MELRETAVLVTGASSGIGRATAMALADEGARLALVGRNVQALAEVAAAVRAKGREAHEIVADLTEDGRPAAVAIEATDRLGGLDVLINNAGISHFGLFVDMPEERITALLRTNVVAPILLSRAVLPVLLAQGSGRIVNVGSVFGAIGFACFSTYSASKFALRGFSQSLRRELAGTGVGVIHVAPRATRTPLNSAAVDAMARAVGMPMDPPERVAAAILRALKRDIDYSTVGAAEGLFSRINGLLPGMMDSLLDKRSRTMKRFATRKS